MLPIVAVIVGFIVNGVRVTLMAILVDRGNQAAFDYWHLGNGSLIFSMVAVFILGGICYFILDRAETESKDEELA
jgi:exosortase/archaeosortase family protein